MKKIATIDLQNLSFLMETPYPLNNSTFYLPPAPRNHHSTSISNYYKTHINRTMVFTLLNWFISLRKISSFIHFVAFIRIPFLFKTQ